MDNTQIIDVIASNIPQDQQTYIGPDGLQRCTNCHGNREVALDLPWMRHKVIPCLCRCMAQQRDQEVQRLRDQEHYDRIQRMRAVGIDDCSLLSATFDSDDYKYPQVSDALRRYVEHFEVLCKDGRGILLYGPVGTGKTYYAACVVNALISEGYPAMMTSIVRLVNQIGGADWADRQPMIDRLADYALVALDDLGTERQSDYVIEQMTAILDTLYRSGTPMIITTNQDPSKLAKNSNIHIQRIWDRIRERCHPIAVMGESRRKGKGQANYTESKALLGI